jgi:hypothetical protein
MTISRLIPLHIHGALEVTLAAVLMVAPVVLGFDTAAMLVAALLGALLFGIAVLTHAGEQSALPISTHAAFDAGLALAMAAGAVALGLVDDTLAAAFLATAALAVVLLSSLTRYTPSRA